MAQAGVGAAGRPALLSNFARARDLAAAKLRAYAPPVAARIEVEVQGRPARAWVSGDPAASALVLVHGGLAGAEMHWSAVWDRLSDGHRVIAPELPGFGWVESPGLPSVAAYASWLVALLDRLSVERAWWVGNSFGASVAASVAGRFPERTRGIAMVNGFAMPATPRWLARFSSGRFARIVMSTIVRPIYREASLRRGFVDPAQIPASLTAAVGSWPAIIPRYVEVLLAGDGPPAPRVPPLLLFGAADRLPGTRRRNAEALARRLPGAKLVLVEGAGHFPQVEQPQAFVREIEAWARS
jgi:pimeloyl-ACP methyl ester carboxylesterase